MNSLVVPKLILRKPTRVEAWVALRYPHNIQSVKVLIDYQVIEKYEKIKDIFTFLVKKNRDFYLIHIEKISAVK